ncbi:hypothetical protein [Pseudomonas agarici]|uniref:hypothetical protein n=1 Tax=Pseudomonas agarici TaxID=46677 RepID=UPI0002D338DA|nr:hypothetical protein [Pseudomonas agarici]
MAGIVAPLSNDFSPHNALNPGVNLRLAPGSARQVVQLVANDEHRHNFSLTRTDTDLFVPGCHSDVGGGYLAVVHGKPVAEQTRQQLQPAPGTQRT